MRAALWLALSIASGSALGWLLLPSGWWWTAPLALTAWMAACLFGRAKKVFRWVLIVTLAIGFAAVGALLYGVNHSRYVEVENSFLNSDYFRQDVLVLVPHQDDELNVGAATIRSHVDAGAHVTVVFSTNGDYSATAEERLAEATEAARLLGVQEILTLGYGDSPNGTASIYDSEDVVVSAAGHSQTYGTAAIMVSRFEEPVKQEDCTACGFAREAAERWLFGDVYAIILFWKSMRR